MSWITRCPCCGEQGSLRVVSCHAVMDGVPLTADGFAMVEARMTETSEERVACDNCNEQWNLPTLDTDSIDWPGCEFGVRYDEEDQTFESVDGVPAEDITGARLFRVSDCQDREALMRLPLPIGWKLHVISDLCWILVSPSGNAWLNGGLGPMVSDDEDELAVMKPTLDVLESLLLAHASQGVDISAPAYAAGLATCLQAFG